MKVSLWNRETVTLSLRNRIIGGVPTNPQLIKGWVAANMPDVEEAKREEIAKKTLEELHQTTEEKAEGMWTTFKRNKDGIYIEGRQVKAMFKESANILRDLLIKEEAKVKEKTKSRFTNLKSKVAERIYVEEDIINIFRDGKALTEPDGNEERAIHVMTAQGPRTALKRVDFVNAPAEVTFTLRWLTDGVVDQDLIDTLLEHASFNGLGADRSQGNGLFTVKRIEKI